MSDKFQLAYRALNINQKRAVDAIDGPVMVLAGPGTGKTQVLTLRIANILHLTDTNPNSILALTFTQSAASNMRKRLVSLIGNSAYQININTFHGFCMQLMQDYSDYYDLKYASEPMSEMEKWSMMDEILKRSKFEHIVSFNQEYGYLIEIISAISTLKKENISPDDYDKILIKEWEIIKDFNTIGKKGQETKTLLTKKEQKIKNWKRNKELLLIYRKYQQNLALTKRFDFDDMIIFTLNAFKKNPDFLLTLQEKYLYLLADEYQDTNNSQSELLFSLTSYWGGKSNIFVVGDPNQAIYRFQGASLENTLSFLQKFNKSKVINLDIGYRCGNNIYYQAFNLISHNNQAEIKKYASFLALKNQKDDFLGKINLYHLNSVKDQYLKIILEIKKIINQGYDYRDIAILYRKNNESLDLADVLSKFQIPFVIDSGIDVLKNELIKQFISLLKAIDNLSSKKDDAFIDLVYFDWMQAPKLEILKIGRCANINQNLYLTDVLLMTYKDFCQLKQSQLITKEEWQKSSDFGNKIFNYQIIAKNQNLLTFLETIIQDCGFFDFINKSTDRYYNLAILNFFFKEIKSLNYKMKDLNLKKLLEILQLMKTINASLKMENPELTEDKITLATVHKAKGKEWKFVFLLNFFDRRWGNSASRTKIKLPSLLKFEELDKMEKNEDERRLFYVALTRAKNTVNLFFPKNEDFEMEKDEKKPSIFNLELKGQKMEISDIKFGQDQIMDFFQINLQPAKNIVHFETKKYFNFLLKDWRLSPTSLNNYLSSNKKFIEDSLLHLPKIKGRNLVLGTTIHAALEKMYQPLLIGQKVNNFNRIWETFMSNLKNELLSHNDFKNIVSTGKQILQDYYKFYYQKEYKLISLERNFGNTYYLLFNNFPIKGKIDRLDYLDEKNKTVMVVDYKTGKPKTQKEVEQGISSQWSEKEKNLSLNIRGGYKRQLLFYKLLSDLDKSFTFKAVEGCLDFVQLNFSKKFRPIKINFLDTDMSEFKNLLKEITSEIKSLKFLETND